MYPSSFVGCHAGDLESYTLFKELFHPGMRANMIKGVCLTLITMQ